MDPAGAHTVVPNRHSRGRSGFPRDQPEVRQPLRFSQRRCNIHDFYEFGDFNGTYCTVEIFMFSDRFDNIYSFFSF